MVEGTCGYCNAVKGIALAKRRNWDTDQRMPNATDVVKTGHCTCTTFVTIENGMIGTPKKEEIRWVDQPVRATPIEAPMGVPEPATMPVEVPQTVEVEQ
jgi:hypothetical protein|tara:strand:- start:426 stop:722 length:297 start_codon:yes stop_codon:yes gene_type:complete